jgi:tRNA threonylcarbamoyladenosine biosynthesis protein TsaB
MKKIILIETSTALCSVALAENGTVTAYRESSAPKAHASLTAVFVQEVLAERGLSLNDCDAICVSMGPGSYTGLRVGLSTAKGICFGAKIPLIAINTLAILAQQGKCEQCDLIIPMIDARRMEVYSCIYNNNQERISPIVPTILDENSYKSQLESGKVLFIGDGCAKFERIISHPNARFISVHPKAEAMSQLAMNKLIKKEFEDVAYFEPFYLKDFVPGPKKS